MLQVETIGVELCYSRSGNDNTVLVVELEDIKCVHKCFAERSGQSIVGRRSELDQIDLVTSKRTLWLA